MAVIIRLMGQFKSFLNNQPEITVEAGYTVREVLVGAQILPELVAGVVVDGDLQSKDYFLQDEDDVKLFAVMGG